MLYHLAQQLQLKYSFFNLFHYVSVRAMGAFLGSIALSFLLGNWFIRTSQRNFKSKTREWTPKNHQKKTTHLQWEVCLF